MPFNGADDRSLTCRLHSNASEGDRKPTMNKKTLKTNYSLFNVVQFVATVHSDMQGVNCTGKNQPLSNLKNEINVFQNNLSFLQWFVQFC